MNQKYFGILTPLEVVGLNLIELTEKQLNEYLFEKDLMIKCYVNNVNLAPTENLGVLKTRIELSNKTLTYRYTDELVNEVFEFLLEHYKAGLGGDVTIFNRDFIDETFGLANSEKRKIALNYFNKYFYSIKEGVQIGLENNSERETIAEKRFKTLLRIRNSKKSQFNKQNDIVVAYLTGLTEYFNRELFESQMFIQNMFRFENVLSILISLNKKFKFEENDIFTPKTIAQNIYKIHSEKFHSIKQLDFIEGQLMIEANRNFSYVVSLFFFFKKELQIKVPSAKLFKEIINNNFNLKIGGIKLSDPNNLEHLKRMKKIKEFWTKFN